VFQSIDALFELWLISELLGGVSRLLRFVRLVADE
jgi:hypothetical protein